MARPNINGYLLSLGIDLSQTYQMLPFCQAISDMSSWEMLTSQPGAPKFRILDKLARTGCAHAAALDQGGLR